VRVEGATETKSSDEGDAGPINAMFDDALSAFISVLDQHSLAELAVSGRSAIGILEPSQGSGRSSKARGRSPAARGSRRG
jgi:Rrf2 family nitric oxide-sensitive transcriptional repressor